MASDEPTPTLTSNSRNPTIIVFSRWPQGRFTAQRGGEVVNKRWADLDLKDGWWTIPVSDSKNKLPRRVPLSTPALAILKPLWEKACVVVGASGKRQRAEAAKQLGLSDFRGHDLRRTTASYMASAGMSRLVISKVLD